MGGERSWLRIEIGAWPDADPEELADLALSLRDDLLDLDVDAVELAAGGSAPRGARGLAGADAGTLIVTLSNSAVCAALAGALGRWAGRDRSRKITIRSGTESLEVTGAAKDEQARLITAWLDKHARRP